MKVYKYLQIMIINYNKIINIILFFYNLNKLFCLNWNLNMSKKNNCLYKCFLRLYSFNSIGYLSRILLCSEFDKVYMIEN